MGYRSNVRYATDNDSYKRLLQLVETHSYNSGERSTLMGVDTDPESLERIGNTVVFGWNWIKWYSAYPEVNRLEKCIDQLASEGAPLVFCRVGENIDDIEFEARNDPWGVLDAVPEPKTDIVTYRVQVERPA